MKKRYSVNGWPDVIEQFKQLNRHYLAIGFFGDQGSRILMIAHVNEYGATIFPKNGQWLTIPTKDTPKGSDGTPKPAKEIPGLFRPKGKNVLCISRGGELIIMYYLVKKVTIPSRPFMRTTLSNNLRSYQKMVLEGIDHITFDGWGWKTMLDWLGEQCINDMKHSINVWSEPSNAPATIDIKGKNDPLIYTGSMRNKVTYRIMEG